MIDIFSENVYFRDVKNKTNNQTPHLNLGRREVLVTEFVEWITRALFFGVEERKVH